MYADDIELYLGFNKLNVVKSTLQIDLCNIHDWLIANKLSLNFSKTKSIMICSIRKLKETTLHDISGDQKKLFGIVDKLLHKPKGPVLPTCDSDKSSADRFSHFFSGED